jgi:hypothetical protein
MQKRRLTWVWIVVGLLIFSIIVTAERRNALDWVALRNYDPSAQVSTLANQTTMSPQAQKVFYVNHPEIETQATFISNCQNNGGEKTVILGCYHPDQKGIFILSVDDPRLSGIEQVTAAHELLHAEYDRLSSANRKNVDDMLMDYYEHDLNDKRVQDVIAAYKQSEPNDVVNEMHSVFGTEIANLPAPLETYYKHYFSDRQAVVAYAAKYENAFTSRQNEVKTDDAKLNAWKLQITNDEASLQSQLQQLNSGQSRLSQLKTDRDYADYNAGIPDFNAEVNRYNLLVTETRSLIAQYNVLVTSRNAIALEENQLTQAITAKPNTVNL